MNNKDKQIKHKVIPFPQSPFEEFLDEQKQLYHEDRLTDFICISKNRYKEGEKVDGFNAQIKRFWFGETSTLTCLGLVEVMKDVILEYMRENT